MSARTTFSRPKRRDAQRGISMLFSLIAVVVLTLGAVALVRSVDTGVMVLGNLGFKQDTLAAGSVRTEQAIAWLQAADSATLDADSPANGYHSTAFVPLDPTGRTVATAAPNLVLVDWDGNGCAVTGLAGRVPVCKQPSAVVNVGGGNNASYIITRLCELIPGTALKDCVRPVVLTSSPSSQRGNLAYGGGVRFQTTSLGTYYRIVTRTVGVRGTVSFTETLVHF